MKTVMSGALALVLLASTAQAALAQEDGTETRDEGTYNPAMRASVRNNPENARRAPEARPAPEAPSAPRAEAPSGFGDRGRGDRGDRGDRRGGDDQGGVPTQPQVYPTERDGGRGDGRGQDQGRGGREGRQDWGSRGGDDRGRYGHDQGRGWDNGGRDNRGWDSRGWDNRGWDNRGWDGRGGDRDWRPDRQARPRYDQRHYGQNYRSQQRYRGYAYRPPSGFYVRSWGYGDLLPRSWWSSQYRLNDWWSYGLPIPPIGYEYVRVGSDVLLVDMFSGRVVQVIRNLFW